MPVTNHELHAFYWKKKAMKMETRVNGKRSFVILIGFIYRFAKQQFIDSNSAVTIN